MIESEFAKQSLRHLQMIAEHAKEEQEKLLFRILEKNRHRYVRRLLRGGKPQKESPLLCLSPALAIALIGSTSSTRQQEKAPQRQIVSGQPGQTLTWLAGLIMEAFRCRIHGFQSADGPNPGRRNRFPL